MNKFTNTQDAIEYIAEINESGETAVIETSKEVAIEVLEMDKLGKYELVVGTDSIKKSATAIDKCLFILRNATHKKTAELICSKIAAIKFEEFVCHGNKEINELVKNNKPAHEIERGMKMLSAVSTVAYLLEDRLMRQTRNVRNYISASSDFSTVYNDIDENLFNMIDSNEGVVYVLSHPMGFGKTTKVTKRLFDEYSAKEGYAIGIAPKRVLTSLICDDSRNYKNITVDSEKQGGVFGVINSVIMNYSLKEYRKGANIIIAEEHEEIIAQATGRAVGDGNLTTRADLLKGYMELIKSTERVVLMDAMFSNESAKMIERETGKKVIVVKPTSSFKHNVTVRFMDESTNVAVANQVASNGGNVLGFSDAKNKGDNSVLSALYNSVAKDASSSQLITANTISELDDEVEYIKDIENVIASKQVTFVSPVINSGVSIVNGHADSVHIFSNQVVSLKSAIQTIRRDRKAEVVNISINNSKSRPNTSGIVILSDEIMRDTKIGGVSDEIFEEYMNNESVREVVNSLIVENKIKCDYRINMVIALRILGFNVEFFSDEDLREEGREAKVEGREIEQEERVQGLLFANQISENMAIKLSKERFITNKQRFEIARFEIESTYRDTISEDLIEFDALGATRRKFENNLLVNKKTRCKSESERFKQQVLIDLVSILNINPLTFTGEFSKNDADKFVSKFTNEIFEKDGIKLTGRDAFKIVFKEDLPKGHSTSVVSSFLKSKFGMATAKVGQRTIDGKRVNVYNINKDAMDPELLSRLETIYSK